MMVESPAKKRRKIRASVADARRMTVDQAIATWPKDRIPIEIFSLIIGHLSRTNVQSMRLVNKEFEKKVAHDLFQTVVVPFRPEIYGIAEEQTISSGLTCDYDRDRVKGKVAVMLQDKGMRVFEGFGEHIHRFGMSFEFDYQLLTKPPIKSDQEAITTFWGIYRWPFKKYNRYVQLEGLEATADETRTMARALRFIKNSKELALSIDGGLGWLAGPDINAKIYPMIEKEMVFGESRFLPEEKSLPGHSSQKLKALLTPSSSSTATTLSSVTAVYQGNQDTPGNIFLRILHEAGYEGDDLVHSARTLLESEGMTAAPISPTSSFASWIGQHSRTTAIPILEVDDLHIQSLDHDDLAPEQVTVASRQAMVDEFGSSTSEVTDYYPLKPNDLTNAQKEMLLETEWAQRAFMQSYAIAIIDNPATFRGIETLSIARLPSRHLAILRRADFWTSLSQLRKFSLAIIPDWRDVVKRPESWVDDVRLQPSHAIAGVYQLLKDHIALQESIKVIHFEWLCGGEEALGLFARNQNILAAPLVPRAMDMVDGTRPPSQILKLPFVEHLTLKNCWMSPHILGHFASTLMKQALQTLTLHSVSLSAPIPRDAQPGPVPLHYPQHHLNHQANANFQAQLVQLQPNQAGAVVHFGPVFHMQQALLPQIGVIQTHAQNQAQPFGPSQATSAPLSWLHPPRPGSWAHVIDQITPGESLASIRHYRDLGPEPLPRQSTKLKKIVFNSCGYIRLLLDFDQTMLDTPNPGAADTHTTIKRRNEIEQYMMKPQEHTLGTIINHISEDEVRTLESAWNLRTGWGKANKILALQALADGVRGAGQGRFRGKIESSVSVLV